MASISKVRNSLERFIPRSQFVIGLVTGDSTTPTVTLQGGDLIADNACVAISRTSTGVYSMTITNFQGPRGSLIPAVLSEQTSGDSVVGVASAYTSGSDTATITWTIKNSAGSAADDSFTFAVFAY